jgi:tetratricopeptide (TPR) repeat protein
MSVINQVLKDLGARHSRSELRLTDMLDRRPEVSLPRDFRSSLGPVLMVLAGVLVMGLLLWQRHGSAITSSPAQQSIAVSAPAAVAPVAKAAVIDAVDIALDRESLRLIFESAGAPTQGVTQTYNPDGSIDYTFANARIEAALPALKENAYLNSYSVMQRDRDVVVHLVPTADALTFVEPATTDNGYRTTLGARARNTPAAPQVAATVPDKSITQPAVRKAARPVARKDELANSTEKLDIKRRITQSDPAESYYRQALEKMQVNRTEAAIADLRKAVSLEADMHAARELLAVLLLRSGYSAEAYEELQRGMQLKPEHVAYARLYAQSLIESGQPEAALKVLAVSEAYAAQQPDYRAFMAAVAQRLAQHEDSVRHYMAALDLKPARSAWWVGMAISLEALGRAQEATRAYRTALAGTELNPDLMTYAQQRVAQLGETGGG